MLVNVKFKDITNNPWAFLIKINPVQYENYLGVYLSNFNPSVSFEDEDNIESFPKFSDVFDENWFNSYGVCDSPEQLYSKLPDVVLNGPRKFAVFLTHLKKSEQEEYGWRWHKWGPYIGEQTPTCEYLRDEPVIEEVYVYQIIEFLDKVTK